MARSRHGLTTWRAQHSVTQRELAALLGRSQRLISAWEDGSRSPSAIEKIAIARTLGVEVDALFAPVLPPVRGEAA